MTVSVAQATPAPTVSLSASPSSITSGQSSTLSWSSTNASSCSASGGWSGTKSTSGSQSVSPTSNTTYTITCTGNGGSANKSVTVSVSQPSSGGDTPLINEEFNPSAWSGNNSNDGIWRKNGVWTGTGNNQMDPARAVLSSAYSGESSTGFLSLTIAPGTNPLRGAEIQSMTSPGYGYGYYETRMKTSCVSGGVASFFVMGAPNYTNPELDIEFLLNDPTTVTFTNHPYDSSAHWYTLGFNPCMAFHRYGILWTPGPGTGVATVADVVDGAVVHSVTSSSLVKPANGEFIMLNAWSGNSNFGGGPPTQNSTSVYDYVRFYPNATSVPGSTSGSTPAPTLALSASPSACATNLFLI